MDPQNKKERAADFGAIFASIEKINHRLEKLESLDRKNPLPSSSPPYAHPSTDKFDIAEAIADEIFSGLHKEKACQFEPGKPCDHCSMCNTRGF